MNDLVNKLSSAEPAGSAEAAKSPALPGQHLADNFTLALIQHPRHLSYSQTRTI